MKLGILKGFYVGFWPDSYRKACEELAIDYEMIDIASPDWMDNIKRSVDSIDGFLVSPPCNYQELKTIYDERLFFIDQFFKKPIYPNFKSCYIYESKRNMAAFLDFFGFPHAKTQVFVDKEEALSYVQNVKYPIVIKANIGAGGRAVNIVKTVSEAKRLVNQSFGEKGGAYCTGMKTIVRGRFGIPRELTGEGQRHFIIIQEYFDIKWEWRILKVGDSYFGHQKLLKGNKASGSGLVGWVMPPEELLYLAKDIFDKGEFNVMDADIFETVDGRFVVNELQAQFGSYLDYQMEIDGKPGRLVYSEEKGFVWEEGVFNRINSCLLKVENFVEILRKNGIN